MTSARPNSGIWYDQHPHDYAKYLEFCAERSDANAARYEAEGKPWSAYEIDRARRQARRLRAMALLCMRSEATRAGNVDFLRLSDPTLTREEEGAIVRKMERSV